MKPWLVRILAFCLFAAFPAHAAPADRAQGSASATLDRVAAALSGIRSISSDFEQERRTSLLDDSLHSSGRFFYRAPDCLRWEATQPEKYGFAVCGNRGTRWRGESGPTQGFSMEQEPGMKLFADQVFAWVRADFPWLEARFRIVVAEGEPVTLKLLPRTPAEARALDHVLIVFSPELSHVATVEILETGGDVTRIRFSRTVINAPLDPDLFP